MRLPGSSADPCAGSGTTSGGAGPFNGTGSLPDQRLFGPDPVRLSACDPQSRPVPGACLCRRGVGGRSSALLRKASGDRGLATLRPAAAEKVVCGSLGLGLAPWGSASDL